MVQEANAGTSKGDRKPRCRADLHRWVRITGRIRDVVPDPKGADVDQVSLCGFDAGAG
jgi:hypothetical protein